jgi:predicted O-methyltransferase YrrM
MASTFSGQPSAQRADELGELLAFSREQNVRRYLEIGCRFGDTFVRMAETLSPGALMVAVDLPGAAWGDARSAAALEAATKHARDLGHRVHLLIGDSTAAETRQAVRALAPFDLALIDGDHKAAGVRADLRNYAPLARVVALHDIDPHPVTNARVEVPLVWHVLRRRYATRSIIGSERGMGIGLLWPGKRVRT